MYLAAAGAKVRHFDQNFCENVAHLHGNNVAMYFLYMLFTLQVILLPGIAGKPKP